MDELSSIAKKLRGLDRNDIKNWLRRGELLAMAKTLLGTDDGFRHWLRQQKIAKTTAYKAISAFTHFASVPTSGHFSREAMAVLSQSAEARSDAIALSKRSKITTRTARELVAKYVPTFTPAKESTGYREVFEISGFVIIVKSTQANPTATDVMSVLATAAKQKRDNGGIRAA